jgi:membrane-bound metal-dependent hydrolase YbcI (DUF457 family)
MKLEHHIAISTIIAGILYALFASWALSTASLITGILTDIDHIIDYFIEHGIRIRIKEFFPFFYKERHQRITLLFHGWEWLFCLCTTAVITDFNLWIAGLLVGYGHHIISDYLYNKASIRAYSLIWRWNKMFDSKVIFPRNRGYDPQTNY